MNKEVSKIKAKMLEFLSVNILGSLSVNTQKTLSKYLTKIYKQPISKYLIKPYCSLNYRDADYLQKFKPASGKQEYQSFQDFFTRKLKTKPKNLSKFVWACEGLLCDYGLVKEISVSKVKGEYRTVTEIFGVSNEEIPEDYYFSNVFLHNNNYHRIHSPINGKITRIQRIAGDLLILRPWIYKDVPSAPAFRNERVNIDIVDKSGKTWFLSIIGGPGVGTIKLANGIGKGAKVQIADEISLFLIGSTCCIASPLPSKYKKLNDKVEMGSPF